MCFEVFNFVKKKIEFLKIREFFLKSLKFFSSLL